MADTFYGQLKVNGFTTTAVETLGSREEFIVIETNVDIREATASGGSPTSQANLDKLIQIVAERGQPVILGSVTAGVTSTYAAVLANEHYNAWGAVQGVSGVQLIDRIVTDGVNYGFPADNSGSHLIVTIFAELSTLVAYFS